MKSLQAVEEKISGYQNLKASHIIRTPTASPEIGKRPHFMDETFTWMGQQSFYSCFLLKTGLRQSLHWCAGV